MDQAVLFYASPHRGSKPLKRCTGGASKFAARAARALQLEPATEAVCLLQRAEQAVAGFFMYKNR